MADVGTDHGFLPLYLWQNEISPEVVMCDISEPSLQKAIDAAAQLLEDGDRVPDMSGKGIKYRAGDGLQVLEDGEVDAVAIAGMGGVLITEIMGINMKKTLSFKKYVLLVREGKYICEIITAISPESETHIQAEYAEDDAYWDMPAEMKDQELFGAFAEVKLRREMKVLAGMKKGIDVPEDEILKCERRARYFEQFVK